MWWLVTSRIRKWGDNSTLISCVPLSCDYICDQFQYFFNDSNKCQMFDSPKLFVSFYLDQFEIFVFAHGLEHVGNGLGIHNPQGCDYRFFEVHWSHSEDSKGFLYTNMSLLFILIAHPNRGDVGAPLRNGQRSC